MKLIRLIQIQIKVNKRESKSTHLENFTMVFTNEKVRLSLIHVWKINENERPKIITFVDQVSSKLYHKSRLSSYSYDHDHTNMLIYLILLSIP